VLLALRRGVVETLLAAGVIGAIAAIAGAPLPSEAVAAPIFPIENASAPGGPNEADLVNQPRDVSFVITRLCTQAQQHPDSSQALIDPRRIAVAGQSDGGETAFAVAYDRHSSTAGPGGGDPLGS
jgi:hypothetical protein